MAVFLAAASSLRIIMSTGLRSGCWRWPSGSIPLGNLMMVRLMKESGLAVAMSLSAVLQLVLINIVGLLIFGERPTNMQFGENHAGHRRRHADCLAAREAGGETAAASSGTGWFRSARSCL